MARSPRPGHPFFAGAPQLIAHRGGAGLAPENTIAAFRCAVDEWDADMLEMDVRLTADGRVVVIHDETVDRTTDGTGRIRDMTWAQARELDAGFRFPGANGDAPFRDRGVRIPLFEEVLEAFPEMRIVVEPKAAETAAPLAGLIRAAGAERRVLVGAEFENTRVGARGYPGPWGASRRQVVPFWCLRRFGPAGRWYAPPADGFQLPERSGRVRVVTPGLLRAARAANMPVYVWTVDEPADMRRLLEWGADGIMTDRPDLLAGVLGEVAGRPPPPGASGSEAPGPLRPEPCSAGEPA